MASAVYYVAEKMQMHLTLYHNYLDGLCVSHFIDTPQHPFITPPPLPPQPHSLLGEKITRQKPVNSQCSEIIFVSVKIMHSQKVALQYVVYFITQLNG